jgi:hypothetical protein
MTHRLLAPCNCPEFADSRNSGTRPGSREEVVAVFVIVACVAAVAAGWPIVAALIVSIASRREDRNWSLGGPPRSLVEATARRIVGFHADSVEWPRSLAHVQAETARRRLLPERLDADADAKTRDPV